MSIADSNLVIYSAAEKQYCMRLLEGFAQREPRIDVDFHFGISVDLHRKHCAEAAAGAVRADVLWSSAMDLQMALVTAGGAQPHGSAEAHALPAGAAYRDLAYATTAEPLLTILNREFVDTRIPAGSLGEVTALLTNDPDRFRGRIASYDIECNGLGFLALLKAGEVDSELNAFLRALKLCRPRLFGSNPPLVDEVRRGRAALAWHVLASYANRAVHNHAAVAIAATRVPPLAVSRIVFIPKHAPHPGPARCFVDYLLSREGQRALGDAGLFPIRDDVTGRGAREQAATMRIDDGFVALLDRQGRERLLHAWRAAVNRS